MNQFDKIFKQKLEHHTVDIPSGAWENISSRLPDNKRKNRPWLAIISVFTTILIAGLTAWFMTKSELNMVKNEHCIDSISDLYSLQTMPFDQYIEESQLKVQSTAISNSQYQNSVLATQPINDIRVKLSNSDAHQDMVANLGIDPVEAATPVIKDLTPTSNRNAEDTEIYTENMALLYTKIGSLQSERVGLTFKSFSKKVKDDKACPFTSDFQDKSVDIYVSHDFNKQVLNGQGIGAEDYISLRKSTESSHYSFSAGVRLGYNISYRWNLHTGFNYSQIGEKFQYVDPESNQTRIIIIKDYIYENGKIVDSIVTEEKVLVPGTTKINVYNKYKMFDIPILARYTLLANKYFSLSGIAGVYINVALKQKGMILNHDNSPIDLRAVDDEGHSNFKTQLGVSAYGSISMAYHLTNRVDFLLEPNMKFMTSAMTTNYYPLSQKYNTFGVTTGLRYRF